MNCKCCRRSKKLKDMVTLYSDRDIEKVYAKICRNCWTRWVNADVFFIPENLPSV